MSVLLSMGILLVLFISVALLSILMMRVLHPKFSARIPPCKRVPT